MRTFAYCRVSTQEQSTANQMLAIKERGYDVKPSRIITEEISGGICAMQRPEFIKLVDKLEEGDRLVVLKLDRLGRDNIDVQNTINLLMSMGVHVTSLDLPAADLSTAEGKLLLQMFSAFAEFEKARIIERTKEGLTRAKAEGKQLGRPVATKTTEEVQALKAKGLSQSKAAEQMGVSLMTVKRHWNK